MRIAYDHNLKVAGVGMVPWRRLGPEQWLPQYAIASLYDGGEAGRGPHIVSLSSKDKVVEIPKRNTRTLLADERFQRLIDKELPGYDLMLYRAATVPAQLADRKILMADEHLVRTYENKVFFRQKFSSKASFAPFTFIKRRALLADKTTFNKLRVGKQGIVLQDAELSGGQGTYLVRDFTSYKRAVQALTEARGGDDLIVASDLIPSVSELSIQGCVTQYGVFTGPLQRQIVREPSLYLDIPGASGFCGIQIIARDQGSVVHTRASEIARSVGLELQAAGYKGIFGIDLLQALTGEVYLLETNPRITGATPLLSALYSDEEGVPFYLLHILELGGYDYEITDKTITYGDNDGVLLIVHSQQTTPIIVTGLPLAGTYRVAGEELVYVSDDLRLNGLKSDEFVILPQTQAGAIVKPGGMLFSLQRKGQSLDLSNNKLYNDTTKLITFLRKKVTWHEQS